MATGYNRNAGFKFAKGIPVQLTRSKFEDLLNRHGQWLRWLKATVCFCADPITRQPSPTCDFCKGRGYLYEQQTKFRVWGEQSPCVGSKVRPLITPIAAVHSVIRSGRSYTIMGFTGSEITIAANGSLPLLPAAPHEAVFVDYEYSTELPFSIEAVADQSLQCALNLALTYSKENDDSAYYEIHKISEAYNVTQSVAVTSDITGFTRNIISMGGVDITAGDSIRFTGTCVKPIHIALIGVSERMRWEDPYIAVEGQALAIFPYDYNVGIGDIFTQLMGESRGSQVLRMLEDTDLYELNAFDVSKVLDIKDATGVLYEYGVDFRLDGRNSIMWLTANRPADDTPYSVSYLYRPTYAVIPSKPVVRTSEDQKLPRKVNLAVFDKVSPVFNASLFNKW